MPAAAGLVLLLGAGYWWRIGVPANGRGAAPGDVFFLGLGVLGSTAAVAELAAIALTPHQQAPSDDPDNTDQPSWPTRLGHALGEFGLDAVAAVAAIIGVVLVLVAIAGLGVRVLL